jgi:hypothetical protein
MQRRVQNKRLQNRVAAARRSRDGWKKKAKEWRERAKELDVQSARLKDQLERTKKNGVCQRVLGW